MLGQIGYLISESFRGLRQHRTVVFPSLVTIFLCSLLFSLTVVSLGGVFKLLSVEQNLYSIEAFLNDSVTNNSIKSISENLLHTKRVKTVEFISADSAVKDFKNHFSEEMLELVDENPLPAYFKIQLKEEYQNPVDLYELRIELMGKGFFEEVQAPLEWARRIADWKFKMIFWPIVLSLLLLATLSLIICNSVRLSLFSRQLLVENMKYTGGSPFFIQFPFVLEGLILGFLGSVLSVIITYFLISGIGKTFPIIEAQLGGLWILLLGIVLSVSTLSAYFSYRTVDKFLKTKNFERE